MPSTQESFPQFTRLPAELQLEILGHHRDGSLVHRHHYIRGFHAGKPLERVKDYKCLDLHDPTHIITDEARRSGSSCSHDDDMTDCIYTNDGLASERILLDSSRSAFNAGNKDPRVFSHIWANMATDVFTFQDLSLPPPGPPPTPETFLGALADACPLVHAEHWFWRVRKLALEVSEASLATGYVLSAFDKDMLRRTTSALRTVYVVADRGCGDCGRLRCWTTSSGGYGNGAHLLRLPTGKDGFVAPEDYFVRGAKPICADRQLYLGPSCSSADALSMAMRLKCELDEVFGRREGGGGRPVEVRVVFSPVRLEDRISGFARVGLRPGDDVS